jgi:DNA primase
MALPAAFLDEIRARTSLSGLIGRTLKVTKAGREFKACCPFHGEKTPSFTINDDKGFYHCFGCGAHGDAFRWLTDQAGLPFMDAVRELAAAAGLDVPAPSPEAATRAAQLETVREALDAAQAVYVHQLGEAGAVMEYLTARGLGPDDVAGFGLGYARGRDGSLKGRGISAKLGLEAGLLARREDGSFREVFHDRITIPIHDARGRLIGFGGRVWGPAFNSGSASLRSATAGGSERPKFINTSDTALFDKGRTLFNLHRAAPASRPSAENRLTVVEGYFDVVAMARAGFGACVAPMGTALTEAQLERCWRLHHRPVLLFDGDGAGRKAALRACRTGLPHFGPGKALGVALLPEGKDPDDLLRRDVDGAGAAAIAALLLEAVGADRFLFDAVVAEHGGDCSPEGTAAIWADLEDMAGGIADDETRLQYLGTWRARFEREISAAPQIVAAEPLHAVRRADDGDYAFPDSESDSAAKLIAMVKRVLRLREERAAITEDIKEVMTLAELMGFSKKAITATVLEIESDLKNGPAVREELEMNRVLYRRTLGIKGPLNEAMLPQVVDVAARRIGAGAGAKRKAAMHALIDARGLEV